MLRDDFPSYGRFHRLPFWFKLGAVGLDVAPSRCDRLSGLFIEFLYYIRQDWFSRPKFWRVFFEFFLSLSLSLRKRDRHEDGDFAASCGALPL